MMKTKVPALFMALAVTLSIVGFSYAHWQDMIYINSSVKMAHILIDIKSEKVLMSKEVEKYSSVTYEVSPDRHTIAIYSENLKPSWYIWVGLVMQNQGTLPGEIKTPIYSYDPPDGWEDYFETAEYFYGPYPEDTGFGDLETWGRVKIDEQLKKDGNVTFTTPPTPTPFTLNPTEKAVVWIWIHCKAEMPDDVQGKTVIMYIQIVDDPAI